jgi:Domain of unknown function (DUF4124)
MSTRGPRSVLSLILALAALAPLAVDAQTYRWVDEQGVVHYGDSIPPQYAEKEHQTLNKQGVEIGHSEAQKTPEQLAAEERQQEEALKLKQHDTFLLATYTSVKDIESLRDTRVDQLEGQKVAAEQYVENLNSRLVALQERAKHFRPYSPRTDAHRLPDDLAEDLVHTLNELRTQSNALTAKNQEVTALKAQFNTDIERYRQLRDPHPTKH